MLHLVRTPLVILGELQVNLLLIQANGHSRHRQLHQQALTRGDLLLLRLNQIPSEHHHFLHRTQVLLQLRPKPLLRQ